MPAPKRPRINAYRDSPVSKRRGSAKEIPSDKDNSIIKLLKECSQKQQNYIAYMERFLLSNKCRFQRLRRHLHHHLVIEMKRARVQNSIEERIKEYEKELAGQRAKEAMLTLAVKEMSEQEDKLEKIVKDIVKHKGHRLQYARKMIRNELNQYGPYEEELTDALQRVPAIDGDYAKMAALPRLREMDLDDIEWPEMVHNWSHYSIYWNNEFEEAIVCRRSCGHTVCATCMTQFKARDSPYHWTCPQCRAPSDKVLTNWALMQFIKEIPGQPQRVMVETPQAVPIVPTPFRLERRRDPEPVPQDEVILMEDIDDMMERRRRNLGDLNNRRVNRDLEVLPPPRERDQMIDNPVQRNQMAPAPPVRHNPLPMAPAPPIRHNPPPRALLPMAPPLRAWAPVAQDPPAPAPAVPGFLNPPIPIPADPDLIPIFLREPFAAPWAPFPPLVDPDFDPIFVPQPFPAPWAPPAPVVVGQLGPAPLAAPQNLQVGHIDRMAPEWGIDEEEEDLQDARYRGVPPSPEPERDSDEEDDGEEDFILH
ncbi:hypothetical protein CAEBREN_10035 [Caenorhabditis brenneri]|uniref:RING-type domain-containing protein n=1 Tax=Caenorhabditis brenneri TaxID=135651 RepID=G0NMX9_CAEBE|nr:hypothetical protein CAEBREN_10035 [Caenorhabditis brenneri]